MHCRVCMAGLLAVALSACGQSPPAGNKADAPAIDPSIVVSAHRGGAAYAPENTMLAFRNAVRLGIGQIEADSQLTADGVLVLIHDDTLDRTTDCSGTVSSKTFSEIQDCDAAFWFSPGQPTTAPAEGVPHPLRGKAIRVPAARELFEYLKSLGPAAPELSIEIKDIPGESNFDPVGEDVAAVLVPLIQEFGLQEKTIVQSFWPTAIDAVKRMDPSIRTQFLTTSSFGQTAYQNLAYATARGHDIVAPNFDAPDFDGDFVAAAQGAGKQVIPWTADTRDEIERVAATGVDGIISNFPACMLELQGRPVRGRLTPPEAGDAMTPACPGELVPAQSAGFDRPEAATCAALRPNRWAPATGQSSARPALRVVGMQFKQDVRHVETYASFRTKMRCLMEEHAVPLMRPGLPMLVVYNEDIGLMTLATGARGQVLRDMVENGAGGGIGDEPGVPASAAAALVAMNAAYAPQVAAYQALFGPIDPRKQVFVAATDTFARAYSQTFADIALDYGVYVVATNNQSRYRASRDPVEIAVFGDPELQPLDEVYIATDARVTNQTALWAPFIVDPDAPAGEKNLMFRNDKVPITDIERDLIAIDEGPAEGPEAIANAAGAVVAGFRLGFATSLPAFMWGYEFGQRPANLEPCKDIRAHYMPCMDALGVNVVVQAEANPGRWAAYQPGGWQPMEWMESTWRTVGDPSVKFRYNITPHMVGNLLDLVFDGQSAITARGANAAPNHYVGNLEFLEGTDPEAYRVHQGDKTEFLVLAPWVIPDAPREALAAMAARLAPGSGDALENDYLETAVWADLMR
jgi:glycerophosphoryl diester phosphodiesterase